METRMYYAEVIEELITNLKEDYIDLMKKRMDEGNTDKVNRAQAAIIALGILEDRIFQLEPEHIEL